jgi:Fur family ferric uptake transcriptional regulator
VQARATERQIKIKLKEQGYKLTPQRKAVLKLIVRSRERLSPAEIYEKVRKYYPGIGLVTIYRTLEIFIKLGVICEVKPEGSSRSYLIRRESEHHHHLVCSGCGAVVDFTTYALRELEQRLSQNTGFKIEDHLLEFVGRCPNCQQSAQV